MTPSMREPDDLPRSPLLLRLSALDRLEPSAELDRAVMERARKTIRPARAPRVRHSLRWAAPAALTAALAVIATSMAVRLGPSAARREIASPPNSIVARDAAVTRSATPAAAAAADRGAAARGITPVRDITAPRHAGPAQAGTVARTQVSPLPAAHAPLPVGRSAIFALENVSATLRLRAVPPSSFVAVEALSSGPTIRSRRTALETNPSQWLAWIRQLRAERRTADADREWAAFSKSYPRYPAYASDPGYSAPGALELPTVAAPQSVTRPGK